ncbi:hypothetical protein ACHAXN_009200 [Cyclotella atomus]
MSDDTSAIDTTPSGSSSSLFNTFLSLCWKANIFFSSVAVLAIGLLYLKQDSLLYFPTIQGLPQRPSQNPKRYRSPSEYNVPYETHLIPCKDGVILHSWLLYHPSSASSPSVPTIVFFHGNAGNIGLRLPNAHQMHQYLNANVWLIDYRGYGDSDGVPNENGLRLDAEAVWSYILNKKLEHVDPRKVFVFGRSLGGAVAFHLVKYAEKKHYDFDAKNVGGGVIQPPLPVGVLVENTFTCISDMVDHLLPLVAPLKSIVLRINWDSISIVPKLTTPTLFLAGAKDTLVPHEHMLRLHRERSKGKIHSLVKLHIVKDGTHNETWLQGGKEYWVAIQSFLKEALSAYNSSGSNNLYASNVSSSNNSMNRPIQRKFAASTATLPEMKDSSLSISTSTCPEGSNTEVVMGGEDAAGMISSVGNFMGMAREALKSGSTKNIGAAPASGGGQTYKKRE